MGYYLQAPSHTGKAAWLTSQYAATRIASPPAFADVPAGKALVCVIANPQFEAAAYCYDAAELTAFSSPDDPRPRTWLLMDEALVRHLAGYPAAR